jgi:hypothetical protein
LSSRGIIEAIEQQAEFNKARKEIVRASFEAMTVFDEKTGKRIPPLVPPPPPTRQQIWDKVVDGGSFNELRKCIEESAAFRNESVGRRL